MSQFSVWLQIGRPGFRSPAEVKDFSYSLCPDQPWGPPSLLSTGYRGSFPGGKARLGNDADHSPHLVPRSRMSRCYSPSYPWHLHGVAGQLYLLCFISSLLIKLFIGNRLLIECSRFRGHWFCTQSDQVKKYISYDICRNVCAALLDFSITALDFPVILDE
jgi:hypothetical protein